MARPCTVCESPRLGELEADLANPAGPSRDAIARKFSVSRRALGRHEGHAKAGAPASVAVSPATLGGEPEAVVRLLLLKSMKILDGAERSGSSRVALSAVSRTHELIAAVLKARAAAPPDYSPERDEILNTLRCRVVKALQAHPEALEDVRAAFEDESPAVQEVVDVSS
jgi:hypothetical protein